MELGPDDYSDERALQTIECTNCDFQGVAFYEESRRGRNESWHHNGYIVNESTFKIIQEAIKSEFKDIDVSKYLNNDSNWFPLRF